MYENGNVKWFSQTLLTYKDNHYASDGYLRVSISTNTENYKLFSPPYFNISISNNYQKSVNFNYPQALDLRNSFEQAIKSSNGEDPEVAKKIKDTMVYFKFTRAETDRVVKAIIQNSDSDLTTVIFPLLPTFQALVNIIKYYTDNYVSICKDLLLKSIDSESQQIIAQLPSLIKGISSQIISTNNLDSGAHEQVSDDMKLHEKQTEETIDDLDKFIKTRDIKVDEIESGKLEPKKNNFGVVESAFVEKVLKDEAGNIQLRAIEDLLENAKLTDSPIEFMASEITRLINPEDENFSMLPGLKEDDRKSLNYISKIMFSATYQNYITNGVPIPSGVSIFKYKPEAYSNLNQDIAYDLFLFGGYLRSVRRKLESKLDDAHDNRSLQYFEFRLFTDPFVFGILDTLNKTELKSVILNRYRYYDSIDVFEFYKEFMVGLNTPTVDENDIALFVDEVSDLLINVSPYINELHEQNYLKGVVKLPSKNEYKLEQIINTVIPLEVSLMLGKKMEEIEIPDEFKSIFEGKPKKQPKIRTETNLERLIRGDLINEVPENHRDHFQKYIKDAIGNNNFVFNTVFPYEEFGDDVIKALYVWKPEDDEKLKVNFNYLKTQFAEVLHTKETILAQEKYEETQSGSDWSNINFG